ncbi:MAG: hypothetical protein WBY44_01975 [Bryobacteraceae bacterium]|jgi:hypothetical protein
MLPTKLFTVRFEKQLDLFAPFVNAGDDAAQRTAAIGLSLPGCYQFLRSQLSFGGKNWLSFVPVTK